MPEPLPTLERDPVVRAIEQSEPATPIELLQAAETLLNLNRPELAHNHLKKLWESKPDAGQLVGLYQRFGSALFIRLSQEEQLAPEGIQLAQAVLEAAGTWARSRRRIDELVERVIADPSPLVRAEALDELRAAPDHAVAPLVGALRSDSPVDRALRARRALLALGDGVVEPMVGFLHSPDQHQQAAVIELLGELSAERAVPHLLRPYLSPGADPELRHAAARALDQILGARPSLEEGRELLAHTIRGLLDADEAPSPPDPPGMVTLWRWDPTGQTVTARRLTAHQRAVLEAAHLAAELNHLCPERSDCQRLFLLARLESAKRMLQRDGPLPQGADTPYADAVAAGTKVVEQVLRDAMESSYLGASLAAAEVLADIGNAELLAERHGDKSPLIGALRHPNRQLRMAAARAIMKLDPRRPYAGASHLTQLLGYVISTQAAPRVLVASPNTDEIQTLSGLIRQLGMEVDAAPTGRQFSIMAVASPDYEFLLISDAIPRSSELVQSLRQHPNTATLPIALLARSPTFVRSQRLARRDRRTLVYPRIRDRDSLQELVERLIPLAEPDRAGVDDRLGQASEALGWLARLADSPAAYGFYDIGELKPQLQLALGTPELSAQAAKVLAKLAPSSHALGARLLTPPRARP